MKITIELPPNLGVGRSTDIVQVVNGLISGWAILPLDIQKAIVSLGLTYQGSPTVPLPEDGMVVETSLAFNGGRESIERTTTFHLSTSGGDIAPRAALAFKAGVMKYVRGLVDELGPDRGRPIARLL